MGRAIEQVALQRNHQITARFDITNNKNGDGLTAESLRHADVAIEFSNPECAVRNIERLLDQSIPVVVGTTGWYDRMDDVSALVTRTGGTLIYSPNFAPGVNLFFGLSNEPPSYFHTFLNLIRTCLSHTTG